jgi:hypothetical protein
MVTYRIHTDDAYFATLMRRYWRQRPLFLRPIVQFSALPIAVASLWLLLPWKDVDATALRWAAVAWAVLMGPGAYFLVRTLLRMRFRGAAKLGTEIIFSLSGVGIAFSGPISRGEFQWQLYPRAVRFPDGIMLIRPRVVCWLPDSSLAEGTSSEATELVKSHTKLRNVA